MFFYNIFNKNLNRICNQNQQCCPIYPGIINIPVNDCMCPPGPTGPQGPQGIQGETGPQGPSGTANLRYAHFYNTLEQDIENDTDPINMSNSTVNNGFSNSCGQITFNFSGTYQIIYGILVDKGANANSFMMLRDLEGNLLTGTNYLVTGNSQLTTASIILNIDAGNGVYLAFSGNNPRLSEELNAFITIVKLDIGEAP